MWFRLYGAFGQASFSFFDQRCGPFLLEQLQIFWGSRTSGSRASRLGARHSGFKTSGWGGAWAPSGSRA